MNLKRLLISVLAVAALAMSVGSASAVASEPESAEMTETAQVLSFDSPLQKVTIIHDALLDAIFYEGEYVGTCQVKTWKNRMSHNCHGDLVSGNAPDHTINLSGLGFQGVITSSGRLNLVITR